MISNFYEDLEKAHGAEIIVLNTFQALAPNYHFTDVSSNKEFWHKGDILATSPAGAVTAIEVKDDSCIARTGNVLCEDQVFYHNKNGSSALLDGNMHSNYEIYCVVSQEASRIVVLDFKTLYEHYHEGRYVIIPHAEQTTYAYLMSLEQLLALGAIIAVIDYSTNTITYKNDNSRNK